MVSMSAQGYYDHITKTEEKCTVEKVVRIFKTTSKTDFGQLVARTHQEDTRRLYLSPHRCMIHLDKVF